MEDLKWMDSANCSGTDTEHFFAGDTKQYEDRQFLIRVCNNCEVIKECKDYAVRHAVQGWWGNTSDKERRNIRQRLNITPIAIVSDRVYN